MSAKKKDTTIGKEGKVLEVQAQPPKPTERAEKAAELHVCSSTEEAQIVQSDREGGKLRFDSEDFKTLPDAVLSQLHYENTRDYFLAKASWEMGKKAPKRKPGEPRLEILDPLARRAMDKIDVKVTDPEYDSRWHTFWASAEDVDVHKDIGYSLVGKDEPVKVRCGSNASGHIALKGAGGRDELVLMKVEKKRYEQHLEAVAQKSRERTQNAPRADLDARLDEASKGRVRSYEVEEEVEKAVISAYGTKTM
jgi:hypothetical protein